MPSWAASSTRSRSRSSFAELGVLNGAWRIAIRFRFDTAASYRAWSVSLSCTHDSVSILSGSSVSTSSWLRRR